MRDSDEMTRPAPARESKGLEIAGEESIPTKETIRKVVAIGAADGGQEALEQFFTAMPADCGLSFVVIMHLPPDGPSFLPEMLSRYTPMPVLLAETGKALQPDTVYVLSPGRELILRNGRFHLVTTPDRNGPFHPIDSFFRSLAAESEDPFIAIIFSGGGTDGAEGVQAVSEAGGMVIAQDPDSAINPAMPRKAIATGLVDMILAEEEVAEKIVGIVRGTCQLPSRICRKSTLDEDLTTIFNLVKAGTGHDFSSYKKNTVIRRIERRMTVNGVAGIKKYIALLNANEQETQALAQDIFIGVTSFFRDPEAFEELRRKVFPQLFTNCNPDDPVRIWHACCATGEEVYSTAILVLEYLREHRINAKVQFFATDIDEIAITHARAGLYSDDIESEVGEERLKTFFTRVDGHWQVSKELRGMVVFAHHNLIKDPPFSRLDFLVCRNFLIYLNPEMQKRLISLFHLALKPRGILFLGAAEGLGNASDLFSLVSKKWKIFERREGGRSENLFFPVTTTVCRFPRSDLASRPTSTRCPSPEQVASKLLLERYSPPCLLVNEKYELIHVFNEANRFLEIPDGESTRDILKMAREELRPPLRAAIYKAFSEMRQVSFKGIKVTTNGTESLVNVLVEPLNSPPPTEKTAMVILEPTPVPQPYFIATGGEESVRSDEASNEVLIHQLEEQLRVTHEQLFAVTEQLETSQEGFMSANEELMSINEEFQSANEELQSTNEELETSKEELQALNEELATVNAELQGKLEELNQANSDLGNLLSSSEIATLFLDRQLTIRLFSPAMADIFNLIPADIGRPFRHLAGTIDWAGLPEDARTVLVSLEPLEREVATSLKDRYFLMRILPYHVSNEKVDGIVVTLVDITERKQAEERIKHIALFPEENPCPVLRVGEAGVLWYANRAADELLAQWRCNVGEAVPEFVRQELVTALANKTTRAMEIDCGESCFSFALVPIIERGYVNFYGSDVTVRNRAMTALRESEERLRLFIEHAPASLAMFDREMRYLSVSRRWLSDYGLGERELIGESHYDVFPEIPDAWREVHRQGLAGSVLAADGDRFERADGSVQWVRWEIHPWRTVSGEVGGIVIFTEDITERKRAEDALRESEQRLARAQEIAHLGSWELDPINNDLTWSDEVYRIFGLQPQTSHATYEAFLERVHPEDRVAVDEAYTSSLGASRKEYAIEHRIVRPGTNEIRWVQERCRHVRGSDGRIIRSIGMVLDITERKSAEEALQESEKKFSILFSKASLPTALTQFPDHVFVDANDAWTQLFGYAKEELLGKTAFELGISRDKERRDYTINELRQHNPVRNLEQTLFSKSGIPLIVLININVIKIAGQDYALTSVQDITELKRIAERQDLLAETTSKLLASDAPREVIDTLCQKVMTHLDCQVFFNFLVAREHGRLRLNACAGIPDEEQKKIEWLDYGVAVCGCAAQDGCRIVAEDIPNVPDPRTDLVKSYGIQAYACHPLMAHGEVIGTLSFGTRTRSRFSEDDLALMKTVSTHVSIAMERKQVEEELRNAKAAAEASTRAKAQFLANMSHELRTPMTGVLGMLDLALSGKLPTEQRGYLTTVKTSAHALLRLLNDILDFSRIEAGMVALVEEPFVLYDTVRGAVELFELEAQRKGLSLKMNIVSDVPKLFKGDEGRIRQTLVNLIGNAIKFTEQGEVKICVETGNVDDERRRKVSFTVSDTGIGIPKDKQQALYLPFNQGDISHTRRFGGTGLGLAISKEVVERMGGTISFASEPGQGSTFVVVLPLQELIKGVPASAPEPDLVSMSVADKLPRPRLLVAEDNPIVQNILGITLRQANYYFDSVFNGKEAVERWLKGNYDLILMDVQMPLMDGFEAVRAIREQEKVRGGHVPIIALTAHAYQTDQEKCLDSGMDAYIAKPFNFPELFSAIKQLLDSREPE